MCAEQAQADSQSAESASIGRRFGKYKPIAMIGRGGMGDIYLAMASGPGGFKKLVVVKCLRTTTDDDDPIRQMFLDEARLAAHLNHPNVVQIFDVGDADGSPYIAMEYLDGQPLSKIRRTVGRLSPPVAARIASDVLAGLHYAHELRGFDGTPLNMVHRDLSPPNILVTYDGVVKLVDFGIAKAALPSRALTDVGTLKGKISYMAPEQAGHSDIDRRVDIFAMGVVLWELIVGRRLVADISPAAALKHLVYGSFPAISDELPGIDSALGDIVAHALEKDPDARYSTALEMREDLEAYLARCGSRVRREELAELVVGHFAVQRAQMQEVIQACTVAVDAGSTSQLPLLPRCGIASDFSSLSVGSRVLPVDEPLSAANPTGLGRVSRIRRWVGLDPQRNRRIVLGGAALALAGVAIGMWQMGTSESVPKLQEPVAHSASVSLAPAIPSNEIAQAPAEMDASASEPSQPRRDTKRVAPADVSRRTYSGRVNARSAVSASASARLTRTADVSQSHTVSEPPPAAPSPASAETAATHSHSAQRTEPRRRAPLLDDRPRVQLVD
ncbi:MAG TPA: serine/threonine-protein kinase [Polyangiaceae bacterium]|nr:serine/threonine-protein kinase [Polyangiaceae bacterium]